MNSPSAQRYRAIHSKPKSRDLAARTQPLFHVTRIQQTERNSTAVRTQNLLQKNNQRRLYKGLNSVENRQSIETDLPVDNEAAMHVEVNVRKSHQIDTADLTPSFQPGMSPVAHTYIRSNVGSAEPKKSWQDRHTAKLKALNEQKRTTIF